MKSPLEQLAVGDRRTTGKSDAVRQAILKNPKLFDEVFEAIWRSNDAGVRMRAADVCEHVTQTRPDLLQARKKDLLKYVAPLEQQEVRWHYCQMLPRLKLTRGERERAFTQLKTFLNDKSGIVRTFAMQAMYDLAQQEESLREQTRLVLEDAMLNGTPAMKSRGRKLLREIAQRK